MPSTYHDKNGTPTLLAVQSDGTTLLNILTDPSTHRLAVSNGTSGSDNGPSVSRHDSNNMHILMATSSADGSTPVAVYANSIGQLLVEST